MKWGEGVSKYGDEILDIILKSTEHPTAEMIFMEMKKRNSKIVQATVYNNLKALAEAGKIIRISHPGFPERYDNTSRHDHLICSACGAISDIRLEDLTTSIEEQLGQKIDSYDLRINYKCPGCEEKNKEKKRRQ